jgi:hypothetical protein
LLLVEEGIKGRVKIKWPPLPLPQGEREAKQTHLVGKVGLPTYWSVKLQLYFFWQT